MARFPAWLIGFAAACAFAGPSSLPTPPEYAEIGTLSQAEADKVLDAVRSAGLAQPAYLEFVLRELPRRGTEQDFPGRLWIDRDDAGPVWRFELEGGRYRFLVQNGPDAAVWEESGAGVKRVPLGRALLPGAEVTPFDLLMPYLYWSDAHAVGIERVLGRPADVFEFRPPPDFGDQVPGLVEVRAYLDSEYHAPLKTECIGPDGRVFKTLALVDLQRVGGQILPRDVDVRDDATRDKTRFSLTAAAVGIAVAPSVFTPASLGENAPAPPSSRIRRF